MSNYTISYFKILTAELQYLPTVARSIMYDIKPKCDCPITKREIYVIFGDNTKGNCYERVYKL